MLSALEIILEIYTIVIIIFMAIYIKKDNKEKKLLKDRVDELELQMLFLYDIKELKEELEVKKCQK